MSRALDRSIFNEQIALGRGTPLGVQIADFLRVQISSGRLSAEDELPSEAELAEEFGVSQRAVRDALRILNGEGVVLTRQGKRAVVAQLRPVAVRSYLRFLIDADASSLDELMDFREILEGYAARLAAERADSEQLEAISQACERAIEAGDQVGERVDADLALHQAIAEAAGNRFVSGILAAMTDALAAERRQGAEMTQAAGAGHEESDAMHRELVDAITARDGDRAERLARTIVHQALENMNVLSI